GLYLASTSSYLASIVTGDFGASAADPGINVFHCNGVPLALVGPARGGAVVFDMSDVPAPINFYFEGNQWDNEPPTRERAIGVAFTRLADLMMESDNVLVDDAHRKPALGRGD